MNNAGEPPVKPGNPAFLCLICIATVVCSAFLMVETAHSQPAPNSGLSPALAQTGQDGEEPHLWQVAEQLRSLTFEAQRALYAAERAEQDETGNTLAAQALKNIESASLVYTENLQPSLAALAPAADAWIQQALDDAYQAAQAQDGPALSAARGRFWTGLLWGAQSAALASLESEDGARAADWLRLREFRRATKVSMIDDLARRTINSYLGGLTNQATTLAVVGDDLRDTYFFRLREALNNLEKAAKRGYPARSAEWTGQLQGYFALLRDDYAAKEGESAAAAVEQALTNLEMDVLAGDLSQTAVIVSDLRGLISSYQPVDLSPEEFARRSQLLYLFIDLVYIEYRDGVRNGQITIETEYLEALTFRDQAEVFLAELYPRISAADPAAAERLVTLLQEMKLALEQLDERQLVRSQVEEALALTEQTLGEAVRDTSGEGIFNVVETLLNEMEQQVARGEYDLAESSRIQAYALFDAGPELRLMAFSPDLVARLDGLFWHGFQGQPGLSLAVAQRRAPAEVAAIRDVLDEGLAEAQTVLGTGAAPLAIITNSAVIVFREGLEAIVILAALMASMVGAYAAFRRSMLVGVVLATIATVITWWIAQRLMLAFSSFGERLEAVVSLIAVGVLLLITNWFFHRVYWKDWLAGFHQRKKLLLGGAAESLLSAQALGFIALGFTSVYREGFETVLFLQALVLDAGPAIVMQGVALGLLATAIVGFFTFQLQTRLPYKKMLVITGILIGGVLLVMVGNTIHTMQAVGWVPISPVGSLNLPYWVSLWLGIFPTWETICGQGAAAVFVIGSYYLAEFQQKQRVRAVAREQATGLKEQPVQTK